MSPSFCIEEAKAEVEEQGWIFGPASNFSV